MKPAVPPPPLASLLSRLVDGTLDAADTAKLLEILRHSPEARDYYRSYLATHLDLAEAMQESPRLTVAINPRSPSRRLAAILLPIAAAITLAAGIAFLLTRDDPADRHASAATATGPVLAMTAVTRDVRWSLPEPARPGQSLHAGRITLHSGTLSLTLGGGQIVTLTGPTDFELIDETEVFLHQGNASLRIVGGGDPCVIRVPHGAVVDLGTEFSVKVAADGTADVWVFDGKVLVSLTSAASTIREQPLAAGQSLRIGETLSPSPATAADFIRPLPGTGIPDSPAGSAYAAATTASRPDAWWRFEQEGPGRQIPGETGGKPLDLHGSPVIAGDKPGHRYLYTDSGNNAGFAMPATGIGGLDTQRGFTIEFLFNSTTEEHGTLIALELFGVDYSAFTRENGIHHAPARAMLERMGRKGAHIGHVHPDFAIRGMLRSQADFNYSAGSNIYSSAAHLLHRWIHVALTHDGRHLRLYIDGALSSEVPATEPSRGDSLRPIIGNMQPDPRDEMRQFTGAIDEVALYGRVLGPDEIQTHAAALGK